MDTKVLEKFCPWARVELIDAVHNRCVQFSLDDAGRAAYLAGSDVIGAGVIGSTEKLQRDRLFARIEAMGYSAFCEQAAYTWFNRFAGIRFMELHGYLSCGVRMLSGADGSFHPDCLRVVSELDLPGLDLDTALDLASAGKDEDLFQLIFVAQCNELAEALPAVFDHVDNEDALTLPDNLLTASEHNVLYHLVTDIPEDAWQDVEILGWMYQFYNAELKADFFKSKRKAAVEDIAPATQLFTPEWIVRYMVDNSLGRLWMLNFPESTLPERAHAQNPADRLMEYYIAPDGEREDFIRIAGPEDITFCDPACGSGHILVYAFKMLFALYEERGYREREIPELILTKNLAGLEIDPRAAQIAQLALALCAREHDRRFFTRNVAADVQVLESVEIDAEQLAETLAHLGELGSLFVPSDMDIAPLEALRGSSSADGLFAEHADQRVEQALAACKALSRRFDVVVANPPYMGSSSFNPFVSKWVKKHYPDSCKDLCTAFIERGYSLANDRGYAAMVTMQSWMFLGSFEKLRKRIIDEKTILTMAHLGPHAFDAIGGEVVSVTADVLYNGKAPIKGAYARLVDIVGSEPKREKLLEAIQDPDCGWFYRADSSEFHDIPGSPIAYWATRSMMKAFKIGAPIAALCAMPYGFKTGDNDRFLRTWWECSSHQVSYQTESDAMATAHDKKWFAYNKGGSFRRWYGNNEFVLNYAQGGREVLLEAKSEGRNAADYRHDLFFRPVITWSRVSSGKLAVRYSPSGSICDMTGPGIYSDEKCLRFLQGLLNSSVVMAVSNLLSPTLDFQPGQIGTYPAVQPNQTITQALFELVAQMRNSSKVDWDIQETSWNFMRSPLI